jgi:triacylglycerol lipase
LEDWIADLDFELVSGPWQGKVHAGFYDALSCVWRMLDADVERLLTEGPRQLWVTGHSLGAALASLAVSRWLEGGRPVAGLYTFGQPRTGDRTFARHFDFAFRPYTFRVVNHLDVVTRTPPRSLGYWHLGTFIYLTETGQLSSDFGWWQRFLQGWQGAIETILDWGAEGLQDHRLQGYRRALDRAGSQPGGGAAVPAQPPVLLPYPRSAGPLIRPRRRAA